MEQITSRDNPGVKRLAGLLRSGKERAAAGAFACEGVRLCLDGVKSGAQLLELYLTGEALAKYPALKEAVDKAEVCRLITPELAVKIGDTKTPQGVFATFKKLDNSRRAVTIRDGGKYLLLDSLQDPGNLGTVLRTAEAFGVAGVFLSPNCPDVYSPKVLRASMGGVFRLPVAVESNTEETIAMLREAGFPVYAAALAEGALTPGQCAFGEGCAVLVGNEGNGLEDKLIQQCDASVMIPMAGGAESLNAGIAAGILIWEMTKR